MRNLLIVVSIASLVAMYNLYRVAAIAQCNATVTNNTVELINPLTGKLYTAYATARDIDACVESVNE